jgi:hypothetical protein
VFVRSGTTWTQQNYLKAHQVNGGDQFGLSVAVSGGTVVVGAWAEDSSTTGVNSTPDELATDAGAVYVFDNGPPPTVTSIVPASGSTAGGTAVTITGTDFTGATGVTIGGAAATSVVVVDATTITAITPAGSAGTASVLVTTPYGTNSANTLYTYGQPEIAVEQPAPTDLVDGTAIVDFGSKCVAATSSRTFTVKSVGTVSLSVGAITFDGANPFDFTVTSAPLASVDAADSTTFEVTFKPLQFGASSAVMHIDNDDPNEDTFDITLTGTGTETIGGTLPDSTTPNLTVPSGDFVATGMNFGTTLGFQPTPGTAYTFINVVDSGSSIIGNFNDLPDGGVVAMSFSGVIYYFQADYTGGVGGNDLMLTSLLNPGPSEWKWTAGPKARNAVAIYGTEDVGADANNPGSRQGAANWRTPDGNLWMFGGYGYASVLTDPPRYLNDLWEYDRVTGRWIWHSGAQVQNQYGTYGSITVAAAANTPGARHTSTSWTDASGDLWLFGGFGYGASGTFGRLNDLWRFSPSTGQWTWMKGSSSSGAAGVYSGAAATLTPGARQGATGWAEPESACNCCASGNLYLFGGTTNGGVTFHNDLWFYSTGTGNWTLVKGNATTNLNGIYGVQGTPAVGNTPGARRDATGWMANDGTL